MRITLIQPKAGSKPEYIHEPLNVGYLAGYLQAHGFGDVRIIVSAFEENDEAILRMCEGSDIVGFTATSTMMKHALSLAQRIKSENPEILTVLGGAHPSIEPEGTLRDPAIDYVIRGEGEEAFHALVSCIDGGQAPVSVAGLSFRDRNGAVLHTPMPKRIHAPDTLPFPNRELLQQERFLEMGQKKYGDRGAWILSSRGCPFRCTYCASHKVWTRKWVGRSPQNIIEEMSVLKSQYRVDRINFADDTFTISRNRVEEFCRRLIQANMRMAWACNARVDTVDFELFRLMRRAGCVEVWMGVEAGSSLILKEIKKDISPNQIIDAFRWAKEAGLKRRGYFMIGSQSESYDTIRVTEELIDLISPDMLAFTILTPYPGSEVYDQWVRSNGHRNLDWSEVNLLETEAVLMKTDHLSEDQLRAEHLRLRKKYDSLWRA